MNMSGFLVCFKTMTKLTFKRV